MDSVKSEQLQIRVSSREKALIKQAAKRANLPMSDWVLSKILPSHQVQFFALVKELITGVDTRYTLAALNDFFSRLSSDELHAAISDRPEKLPSAYLSNYLAAMIEYACYKKRVQPPPWVNEIETLPRPVFASDLISLKLYLLTSSPPPFRRRNIFIDASIGDQV